MLTKDKYLKKIEKIYSKYIPELIELNNYIYENPELGRKEFKAAKSHIKLLQKYGFSVKENYVGIETAFSATYKSMQSGPKIAFLAEYDALPEIGHGCGHNILGTASTGAGLILKELLNEVDSEIHGEVIILGTPAEESDGAKVDMVKVGVFKDIDVAISVHPTGKHHIKSGSSQAYGGIKI